MVEEMRIYVPPNSTSEFNNHFLLLKNDINKHYGGFLLEKDDNNILGDTKADHWHTLQKTLDWLRGTRAYLDKYKPKTVDSQDPLELTTHKPGTWLSTAERDTFGGYTGITGIIDFNADIEEVENLERKLFKEGKQNQLLVQHIDYYYNIFRSVFLESIQSGGSSSTSAAAENQSVRDQQIKETLGTVKGILEGN